MSSENVLTAQCARKIGKALKKIWLERNVGFAVVVWTAPHECWLWSTTQAK